MKNSSVLTPDFCRLSPSLLYSISTAYFTTLFIYLNDRMGLLVHFRTGFVGTYRSRTFCTVVDPALWVLRKKIFFFGCRHFFSEPSTWVWNWSRECATWFKSADCIDLKWSCWLMKWILPSSLVSSCNERIPSRWCVELSGLNEII